jgi:hypothetical protein
MGRVDAPAPRLNLEVFRALAQARVATQSRRRAGKAAAGKATRARLANGLVHDGRRRHYLL